MNNQNQTTLAHWQDLETGTILRITKNEQDSDAYGMIFSFWVQEPGNQEICVSSGPKAGGNVDKKDMMTTGAWWDQYRPALNGMLWAMTRIPNC